VVESVERVKQTILNTYSEPNLPPEEFQAWAGERNDPLREFGNICRHELESLWDGFITQVGAGKIADHVQFNGRPKGKAILGNLPWRLVVPYCIVELDGVSSVRC
jgi:hypothetical protein